MQLKLLETFSKLDKYAAQFGANFVIAFSGGGDSMALLAIVRDWQIMRQSKGAQCEISACIIDHAIAADSAEVAKIAKARALELGINAQIIRLSGKIETKIQENARKMRYEKLGSLAKQKGAKIILLAHNQDDQIETILFRMVRATSLDGLSGMREIQNAPFAENIMLGRPLLNYSRKTLRALLDNRNLEYFDDPANKNLNFSRVKIRERLLNLRENGLDFEKILDVSNAAAQFRIGIDSLVFKLLNQNLSIEGKCAFLPAYNQWQFSQLILKRSIAVLIQAICNSPYKVSEKKIDELWTRIWEKDFKAATLSGIKIDKSKGKLRFCIANPRRGSEPLVELNFKDISYRIKCLLWHNEFEGQE